KALKPLFAKHLIKGVAHITGGGFIENIPRMYADGLAAKIDTSSWNVPPIFDVIEKAGNVNHAEMFNVFNMGIGMVLAVDENKAEEALSTLSENNETAYVIGKMIERENAAVELQ
ncbi:phosphoribosylformylglycinamidine cyclo-ligase, partial [Bifidobacteriaceae bacterium NR003]